MVELMKQELHFVNGRCDERICFTADVEGDWGINKCFHTYIKLLDPYSENVNLRDSCYSQVCYYDFRDTDLLDIRDEMFSKSYTPDAVKQNEIIGKWLKTMIERYGFDGTTLYYTPYYITANEFKLDDVMLIPHTRYTTVRIGLISSTPQCNEAVLLEADRIISELPQSLMKEFPSHDDERVSCEVHSHCTQPIHRESGKNKYTVELTYYFNMNNEDNGGECSGEHKECVSCCRVDNE